MYIEYRISHCFCYLSIRERGAHEKLAKIVKLVLKAGPWGVQTAQWS